MVISTYKTLYINKQCNHSDEQKRQTKIKNGINTNKPRVLFFQGWLYSEKIRRSCA